MGMQPLRLAIMATVGLLLNHHIADRGRNMCHTGREQMEESELPVARWVLSGSTFH